MLMLRSIVIYKKKKKSMGTFSKSLNKYEIYKVKIRKKKYHHNNILDLSQDSWNGGVRTLV